MSPMCKEGVYKVSFEKFYSWWSYLCLSNMKLQKKWDLKKKECFSDTVQLHLPSSLQFVDNVLTKQHTSVIPSATQLNIWGSQNAQNVKLAFFKRKWWISKGGDIP